MYIYEYAHLYIVSSEITFEIFNLVSLYDLSGNILQHTAPNYTALQHTPLSSWYAARSE